MTRHVSDRTRAARAAAASLGAAILAAASVGLAVQAQPNAASAPAACPGDNGGVTLSPGFCATVFADNLGHIRHMAAGPNGVIYVNTWSGVYFPGPVPQDGFLLALQDTRGDGRANVVARFGETAADGSAGGSGVAVYQGYVYAEVNDKIVRFRLAPGSTIPTGKPEVVVSGLPLGGDHPMHPFVIDAKGQIFVDVASASNACQDKNRQPGVPGASPCVELNTRGGIWHMQEREARRGAIGRARGRSKPWPRPKSHSCPRGGSSPASSACRTA